MTMPPLEADFPPSNPDLDTLHHRRHEERRGQQQLPCSISADGGHGQVFLAVLKGGGNAQQGLR